MTGSFDFPRFKQEINLTQYAATQGYKIDRKKSTRNSIAMRLDSSDKVIVSKRNGLWVYFSVYDDQDNGTIIDFVKNRTNKSLFEIGKELNIWTNGNMEFPKAYSFVPYVEEKKIDPKRIKRLFNYCVPATDHDYLQSRGISAEILTSPRFSGRVFQDHFKNAVFPHFKEGHVCGLELKGENTGLFVRGSEKTLWRSNVQKEDDTLIISETPIDAISYQILHSPKKAFYIATCGGFSSQQGDNMRKLINDFQQIKKVILITDNDQGGDLTSNRISAVITETDFKGLVTRHSPKTCGFDWNDVLKSQLNI